MFEEETDTDKNTFELKNETELSFVILINLPAEYSGSPLTLQFHVEFQQLHAFLEEYMAGRTRRYITGSTLLNRKLQPNSTSQLVIAARDGILRNLHDRNCINLYHAADDTIQFGYLYYMGETTAILVLNEMQAEILCNKLLTFHNDLTLKNIEILEREY